MSTKTIQPKDCPNCGIRYPNTLLQCPECQWDRLKARDLMRKTTAYAGARTLTDVLMVVGFLLTIVMLVFALRLGQMEIWLSSLTLAAAMIAASVLQRCLIHAVLDIADNSISW